MARNQKLLEKARKIVEDRKDGGWYDPFTWGEPGTAKFEEKMKEEANAYYQVLEQDQDTEKEPYQMDTLGREFKDAYKPEDAKELLEDIEEESEFEKFDFKNWWEEEPKEETKEERLERQIEHFNNMRSHVSDLDEDYLLDDAPRDHWEQGLQSRPDEREMTQIVEGLQRRAMQQGNVGATVNMPFDPKSVPSNQGFPMTPAGPNPIIQALQNQNRMGRPGLDVNSLYNARQGQGMNAPIMQPGVSPLMGIGGGNRSWGAGTMNRGWNPYA